MMRCPHGRLNSFALLLLLAVVPGCSGCDSSTPASGNAGEKVRVATLTWVGYGPLYLAKEKGFFKGIDVELVRIEDTSARRAALASGDVQVSVDIVDSFSNAAAVGIPAKVILKLDDSKGGDGIVVHEGIEKVEDLKGKTIAYPTGQPSHYLLLTVLAQHGMSVEDVRSKEMEADQAGAAFMSKNVDAAVTWEPWLTRASKLPNCKILVSTHDVPELIADVLTARNDFIEKKPDAVRALIEGWLEAVEYWKKNPDESNEIMARSLGLKADEFAAMVSGIQYSDAATNRAFFTADDKGVVPFHRMFEKASTVWKEAGLVKSPRQAADVDGSPAFLKAAP